MVEKSEYFYTNNKTFLLGVPDDLPISFHTEIPANQQVPVSRNTVIKFPNVLLDTRQSFHTDGSIFIIPVSGVYVMHWTISVRENTRAETQLMVNICISDTVYQ